MAVGRRWAAVWRDLSLSGDTSATPTGYNQMLALAPFGESEVEVWKKLRLELGKVPTADDIQQHGQKAQASLGERDQSTLTEPTTGTVEGPNVNRTMAASTQSPAVTTVAVDRESE